MSKELKKLQSLLEQANALVTELAVSGGDAEAAPAAEAVEVPTPKAVAKMDEDDLRAFAASLGSDVTEVKPVKLKRVLTLAATIHHSDEEADFSDQEEEVQELADVLGIEATGKPAKVLAAVKAYLAAEHEAPAEAAEAEEDADDEEAKPAKKGKKGKPAEEDVDNETKVERLGLYNKVAKKKLAFDADDEDEVAAAYTKLLGLFKDDEGEAHGWGEPYSKTVDDEPTAHCNGFPLKDVEIGGEEGGKDIVTGQCFIQNAAGDLIPAKVAKKSKPAAEEED